ncbi:MAG: GNAT family N-acetyltransferase [Peptostreptococcaceae bacterium]
MITKVDESLEKSFWEYISHEESINLFIIGDVENYGLETEFQEIWFQIENEKIVLVMLKYYRSLVIYSYENDFNVEEVIDFINQLDIKQISGKKSVIDKLIGKYRDYKKCEITNFLTLKKLNEINFLDIESKIMQKANEYDLEELNTFLSSIEEIHSKDYIKSKNMQLKDKSSRIYFIKENDKIISTISTGIESSFLAMICDVGVDKEHKNIESITYMIYTMSKELVKEGKMPCLFYKNKDRLVGEIYEKIGYEKLDNWSILLK